MRRRIPPDAALSRPASTISNGFRLNPGPSGRRPARLAALAAAAASACVPAAVAQEPAPVPAPEPASPSPPAAAPGSVFDPAASGRVLADTRVDAAGAVSVLVRPAQLPQVTVAGASSPALDGDLLAYVDATGIQVVRWSTGEALARVDGPVGKPALDWPLLAYIRTFPSGGRRLEVRDLASGADRVVTSVDPSTDLGRPALRDGLVAWHVAAGRRSQIRIAPAAGRSGSRIVASSVTGLQINPSIAYGRVLWVEHAASTSYLRLRAVKGGRVRTLATLAGPRRILWTTALGATTAFATRWDTTTRRAVLVSRTWRRAAR
ncbi:MAG: hypothetical protein AB7V42_07550 [Thermoleophilia bacterium]